MTSVLFSSITDDPSKVSPSPISPTTASPVNSSADNGTQKTTTTPPAIVFTNRPLLGQNGTGQRWATVNTSAPTNVTTTNKQQQPMVVSEPIIPVVTVKPTASSKPTPTTLAPVKPAGDIPYPKIDPPSVSSWDDEYLNVGNIDSDKTDLTEDELKQKNLTLGHEEHHVYYNSTTLQNTETVQEYLRSFQNLQPNSMLSKSHRRAMVRMRGLLMGFMLTIPICLFTLWETKAFLITI